MSHIKKTVTREEALTVLINHFVLSTHNLLAQAGVLRNDYDHMLRMYFRPVCLWNQTWINTTDGEIFIDYLSEKMESYGLNPHKGFLDFEKDSGEVCNKFRAARAAQLYHVAFNMLSDAQMSHIDGSNHEAGKRVSFALDKGLNTAISGYME